MNPCSLQSSRLWSSVGGAEATVQLVPACLRTAAELLQGCLSNPSYPAALQGRHFSTAGPSSVSGSSSAKRSSCPSTAAASAVITNSSAQQGPSSTSPEHGAMDPTRSSLGGAHACPGPVTDSREYGDPCAANTASAECGQPHTDIALDSSSSRSSSSSGSSSGGSSSSSSRANGQRLPLDAKGIPVAWKQGWWGSCASAWHSSSTACAAASLSLQPPTAPAAAARHAPSGIVQKAPAAAAAAAAAAGGGGAGGQRHCSSSTVDMTPPQMLAVHDELVLDELLEEAAGQNLGAARSFTDLWAMTTGLGRPQMVPCNKVVEDAEKEFLRLLVRTTSRHQQLKLVGAWSYFLDQGAREYRPAVLRRAQQLAEQQERTLAAQRAVAAAAAAAQAQQAAAAAAEATAAQHAREEELQRFAEQWEPLAWGPLQHAQEAAVSEIWADLVGCGHMLVQASPNGLHLALSIPQQLSGPNRSERLAAAAGVFTRKAQAVGSAACQLPLLEVCEPWTETRDLGLLLRLALGHPHPALVTQCLGDEGLQLDGSATCDMWGEGSSSGVADSYFSSNAGLEDWAHTTDSSNDSISASTSMDVQPWQDNLLTTSELHTMLQQHPEGEEPPLAAVSTNHWSSDSVRTTDIGSSSSSHTEALSSWDSTDMQHGSDHQPVGSSSSGGGSGGSTLDEATQISSSSSAAGVLDETTTSSDSSSMLKKLSGFFSSSSSSKHASGDVHDLSSTSASTEAVELSSSSSSSNSSGGMARYTGDVDCGHISPADATFSAQHRLEEEPVPRLAPEQQQQQWREEMQQQLAAIIAQGRSAPLYTGFLGHALWLRPRACGPDSPWEQLKQQVVREWLPLLPTPHISPGASEEAGVTAAAGGPYSHVEGLSGSLQDTPGVVVLDSRQQWLWQADSRDLADCQSADADRYAQGAAKWLRSSAADTGQGHQQPSSMLEQQLLEQLQEAKSPAAFQEMLTQYAAYLTTDTILLLMQRSVETPKLRHMLPWLLDQWEQQQQQQQQQQQPSGSSAASSGQIPGLSLSIQQAERLLQECLAAPLAAGTAATQATSSSTTGVFAVGRRSSRGTSSSSSRSGSGSGPWFGHHIKLLVQLVATGTLQGLPTQQLLRLAEAWPALLLRYQGPAAEQVAAAADLLQQEILGQLSKRPPGDFVDVGEQQLVQFIDWLLQVREAQPAQPVKQGGRQRSPQLEAPAAAPPVSAAATYGTLNELPLTAAFQDLQHHQQQQLSVGGLGTSPESPARWAVAVGGSVDGLRAALAATAAPAPTLSSSSNGSSSRYAERPAGYIDTDMSSDYEPEASPAAAAAGGSGPSTANRRAQQLQQTYACIGIICKVLQQRIDALAARQCISLVERVKRWEQVADGGWSRLHGEAGAAWRAALWELQRALTQHLVRLVPQAQPSEVVDALMAVKQLPYHLRAQMVRATQAWAAAATRQQAAPVYLNMFECEALITAWKDLDKSKLGLDRAKKNVPPELAAAMEGLGTIAAATIAAASERGGSRGGAAAAGGGGDRSVNLLRLVEFLLPYKQLQFWHPQLVAAVSGWLAQQAGQRSTTPPGLTSDGYVVSQLTSFLATFHTGDPQVSRGYSSLLLKLNLNRWGTSTLSQLAWGAALFGVREQPVWQALSKAILHQLSLPVKDEKDAIATQHRLLMSASYCRLTPGLSSIQLLPQALAEGWEAAARAEAAAASAEAAADTSAAQPQQGPPPPLPAEAPAPAAAAAAAAGQDVQGSVEVSVSQLQRDIFNAITLLQQDQELRISHIEQEHAVGMAGASVDILVVVNGVKVALEVDGPSHYSSNKPKGQYMLLGQTLLRDHLRQLEGLQVVRVPWFEWDSKNTMQRRSAWLKEKLQEAVAQKGRAGRPVARR